MNKFLSVFLAVVVVILIAFIILRDGERPWSNSSNSVEITITTTPGTKVFAKQPGGEEQFLNTVSALDDGILTVEVPIDAEVILRYDNNEEIIAYEEWREEKLISVNFNQLIPIMINARPEAHVFIMLPNGNEFIEPRTEDFIETPEPSETDTNLIPLRGGGLKVPIGTVIKLVYEGKEKIFPYEIWKKETEISHNFLNP